jgi:hypothetical protein
MRNYKSLTEEVEEVFKYINSEKGWSKPKIQRGNRLWRPIPQRVLNLSTKIIKRKEK